ncbi:MAG: PocR ligand-binding domain-containing protein [Clostridia bacterium]|nr:PocR ligand-binding domain-containing protein [Clostridia bacterium]
MILKFDKEKLDRILSDFSLITGVPIAILGQEFEYIANSRTEEQKFCLTLQEADNCYRCKCSDMEMLEKCKISKKAEMHICHAGLCDMAVPLVSDGEILAYIILGRIRTDRSGLSTEKVSWFDGDINELCRHYESLAYYDKQGLGSVANIAVAVASYILGDGVIKPQYNLMAEKAARYIDENLSENLTVSSLCRYLGVSKNLLYENFNTAFGSSIKDYITKRRLHRALNLLTDTELSVGEIADSVGICNHTYFSRLISTSTGMSPLKYRKSSREK